MRNLDMTTLRSFLAVAEQGGVTRAAAALNLTQSAVSMQLKRLEDMLDIELLDRSNRRVTLTAPGEQLLSYARRMVQLNDEAVGRLTDKVYEGEIVLGVPHDIVYPVIPRVLKTFNSVYPRVKVHLRSRGTVKLHEALARNELDLILTTEEDVKPGGETLTQMPLRWTGAVAGQAWRKRPLRLGFCRFCIFRPIVLRKVQEAGIDWELAVDSEDDRAVEALVSSDLAVGAMLEDSIPPHLEAIAPGDDLPELGFQNVNMYGSDRATGEVAEQLAAMLRNGYAATRRPVLSSCAG
ncbi:LysR family transcriptional regulator [Roseovarius sp. SYSU LYC5161]|uniref:LysR family transcriptional regulator n=1 Tax=Roseovarius halophilus (ex Wu et al. 2025) TaxID=3376060 RepID=UPI002870E1B7|nr:LysR family transcriptional regulator [Roseovarius sp.]